MRLETQNRKEMVQMIPDAPESTSGDADQAPAAPREPCRRAEIGQLKPLAKPCKPFADSSSSSSVISQALVVSRRTVAGQRKLDALRATLHGDETGGQAPVEKPRVEKREGVVKRSVGLGGRVRAGLRYGGLRHTIHNDSKMIAYRDDSIT